MPDKEKATKLLGFRDDSGTLVCPADVLDPSKFYQFHIGAEDGSYEPTEEDLKAIGDLLEQVGMKGQTTKTKTKDGVTFKNKKGVVICRVVEGKKALDPAPKAKAPEPEPPKAPEPEPPKAPEPEPPKAPEPEPPKSQEAAKAADEAVVKTSSVKKTNGKKSSSKRVRKPTKRGK